MWPLAPSLGPQAPPGPLQAQMLLFPSGAPGPWFWTQSTYGKPTPLLSPHPHPPGVGRVPWAGTWAPPQGRASRCPLHLRVLCLPQGPPGPQGRLGHPGQQVGQAAAAGPPAPRFVTRAFTEPQMCFLQGAAGERGHSGARGFPVSIASSCNFAGYAGGQQPFGQVPILLRRRQGFWGPTPCPGDPRCPRPVTQQGTVTWDSHPAGNGGRTLISCDGLTEARGTGWVEKGHGGTPFTFARLRRASPAPRARQAPRASQENQ